MKKIGILVNSIGYGGNERSAVNVAKVLRLRHDVSIIIQEDRGNHYGYEGKVINLNTPCAKTTTGKLLNSVKRVFRLRKTVKQKRFDTLFIILPISNPINYLRFGCKKIVSCRDCGDLIRHKKSYIRMTMKSDLIVCNSLYQAEYLKKYTPDFGDKTRVIYNIIDFDGIQRLKQEECDESVARFINGHRCIISIGRFAKAKGLNNLLKAFSLVVRGDTNVRMIMIGDGELRSDIERLINDLHLSEKILLTGFQDNPFKYIYRCSVFILPSFFEGFPNTLVEAMACGKPVIAMDCPSGPAEILEAKVMEGYTVTEKGILMSYISEEDSSWDPKDIREGHHYLADAIKEVLQDQKLAEILSKGALSRAKDFSAEHILDDWEMIV